MDEDDDGGGASLEIDACMKDGMIGSNGEVDDCCNVTYLSYLFLILA